VVDAKSKKQAAKVLLTCGIVAGPLYLAVSLVEALTREGFDITRHSLSLLSNGTLGWVHITLFVVTGLLVIGAAAGMRRAFVSGKGRTWVPALLALYGLSLIGAGVFIADPSFGFPPGTPEGAPSTMTTSGFLHFAIGGIGFLALIAACFVMAKRFGTLGQPGWKTFSWVTGAVFLLGFIGIASGSGNSWTILGFWVAVILAWTWLSAVLAKLKGELS
jgi:hypothetical protein